jgi:hypothetical protein
MRRSRKKVSPYPPRTDCCVGKVRRDHLTVPVGGAYQATQGGVEPLSREMARTWPAKDQGPQGVRQSLKRSVAWSAIEGVFL